MDRRFFLTTIPAAVSGCLSVGGSTTATRPEPPKEAKEPPSFQDADEVHYPASAGSPIVVTADPSTTELPGATLDFEATNDRGKQFETNFYHWRLHKRVGERWWHLGVFENLDELNSLNTGETHTWEASVANDQLDQLPNKLSPSAQSSFTLAGVGAGTYAFSVVGSFEGDDSRIAAVTPFKLEGENVGLQPTPYIETSREGETVQVTYDDPSPDIGDEYELKARRQPSDNDALPLVPEWGLRQEGIRNTLPLFSEGIQMVVYTKIGAPPAYAINVVDDAVLSYKDFSVEFNLRKV